MPFIFVVLALSGAGRATRINFRADILNVGKKYPKLTYLRQGAQNDFEAMEEAKFTGLKRQNVFFRNHLSCNIHVCTIVNYTISMFFTFIYLANCE